MRASLRPPLRSCAAKGLSGIGIPALMKRAGLTHGAFYAHFPNRDALVAEAIRAASDASVDGLLAESLPLEQTPALYSSPSISPSLSGAA